MLSSSTVFSLVRWFAKFLETILISIVAVVWLVYEETFNANEDIDTDPTPPARNHLPVQTDHHPNVITLSDFRCGRNR